MTRTIKTQNLKSQVRLANLTEQKERSIQKRRQSEIDYRQMEEKVKLISQLCDKRKIKKQDSIIYMTPSRPHSEYMERPKLPKLKASASLPHNSIFRQDTLKLHKSV